MTSSNFERAAGRSSRAIRTTASRFPTVGALPSDARTLFRIADALATSPVASDAATSASLIPASSGANRSARSRSATAASLSPFCK